MVQIRALSRVFGVWPPRRLTLIWAIVGLVSMVLLVASPSRASGTKEQLDDVFGNLGTAQALDDVADEADAEASAGAPLGPTVGGVGAIFGRVVDSETGMPVSGATIILAWPTTDDRSEPKQEIRRTDPDGDYEFGPVAAARYDLTFVKSGYRTSAMTHFIVEAGRRNRADFPLQRVPERVDADVLQLDAFVVEASAVDDLFDSLALRMDSDISLNVMSAEDLSKYAASDVADALGRVAGVNIIEGQFAIIRGLEDRYSSTLYNGAPVPSPDPNSQSVQLDLFPSEVVGDLEVAKTFAPDQPSNSAGGSIDIGTHAYPDALTAKIKGAVEVNERALDRFSLFQRGSPMGEPAGARDVVAGEFGGMVGGRSRLHGREARYKAVLNWESDYAGSSGFQEGQEPRAAEIRRGRVQRAGDLALGALNLTDGRFDLTTSRFSEEGTAYLDLGFDLDSRGKHALDLSAFYTRKREQIVELKENGYLPGFDYGPVVAAEHNEEGITFANFQQRATLASWIAGRRSVREFRENSPSRGPLWYSNFNESRAFERFRDLLVVQIDADHDWAGGGPSHRSRVRDAHGRLHVSWTANYAQTRQREDSRGVKFFFEPNDVNRIPPRYPVRAADLGPGQYAANDRVLASGSEVFERQGFGRLDITYARSLSDWFEAGLDSGAWFEYASREGSASFLESPTRHGSSQYAILAATPEGLGRTLFRELDHSADGELSGLRATSHGAKRQIGAWYLRAHGSFWQSLDWSAGFRLEKIRIESNNRPYTGETLFGAPATFPTIYLFFDRLDNPNRGEVLRAPKPGTTFNDQLLGIGAPRDLQTGFVDLLDRPDIDALVNGRTDLLHVLPSTSMAYRPLDGLVLRGAYTQTAARPSFREIGFFVTVEPGSDDLIVGNPQLGLSRVQSADARVEYTWGTGGDLVAASGFYKTIDNPIESAVIRNPLNFEQSSGAIFRTFFNNPNRASLWGVELEVHKTLGFLGFGKSRSEWLSDWSLGGNFTYIDAQVDRVSFELPRAQKFFATPADVAARFSGLSGSRRLFGQPEWIANADLSFDDDDWGTKITLAFFAISDVLDAAGSVSIAPNGDVLAFSPDRYVAGYQQLDLIARQSLPGQWLPGEFEFEFSVDNLTDSRRAIVYDPSQTIGAPTERSFRVGRSFKLSIRRSF